MPFITLESVDCVQFKIDTEVAKFSGTIKTMLEEGNVDDEKDAVVPLPNVSSDILRHIVEWANHHKGDPTIDGDENNETGTDDISEWDSKFLEKLDKGKMSMHRNIRYLLRYTHIALGCVFAFILIIFFWFNVCFRFC